MLIPVVGTLLAGCAEPEPPGSVVVPRGIYVAHLVSASDGCTEQIGNIAPAEWDIRIHEDGEALSTWIPIYHKGPFDPGGHVHWQWLMLHPASPFGDIRSLYSESCEGIEAHEQYFVLEQGPEGFTVEVSAYSDRGWCVGFEDSCEGTRAVRFDLVEECPVGCDMRRSYLTTVPDPLGEHIAAMECDCPE